MEKENFKRMDAMLEKASEKKEFRELIRILGDM